MNQLVSVIIPCFNAEKWIAEAIDSVLAQTYPCIEIIVIDDGSSDRSLSIIQSYGNRVIWHTGDNQGANKARNLGFSLAKGNYIQYLDADDYLLSDKIAKQVAYLESTGADFVYGDWRYQYHLTNGEIELDEIIRLCGAKEDYLQSLLANDRWSNLAPILFDRQIVSQVTWDEALPAAQDRDFLFSVMLAGAKPVYQAGCDSVYRMHSNTTISTASKLRWLQAHCMVMEKAEQKLIAKSWFNARYQKALAAGYWAMGKEYLYSNYENHRGKGNRERNIIDYHKYAQILDKVYQLAPDILLDKKSKLYQFIYNLVGYQMTEKISYLLYSRKSIFN